MDKPSHHIIADQPQRPQNDQYHGNRPQHKIFLLFVYLVR
jgi:hypothetical protein